MKKHILVLLALIVAVSCAEKPFVVVQVADAQLGFDAAVKAQQPGAEYVNDLTYEVECLHRTVAFINDLKPDAVVFTGDQVHICGDEEQWNAFTEIISGIDPDVDCYHVPGNHDVIAGEGKVDTTPFSRRFGDDRFAVTKNGVKLVGINTSLIRFNDPAEAEQLEWLRSALRKEKKNDVTLLFGHHPFFAEDIEEEDGHFQLQKSKRHVYFELFEQMGVSAVFAGHLHDSRAAEYHGIPMLTTTSSAYQLGSSVPSVRVITVEKGKVSEKIAAI